MNTPDSPQLTAALRYAKRAPVFPLHSVVDGICSCPAGDECEHAGKHPRTAHGLKDATQDEEQIKAWWARWPDANVAIATGKVSRFLVVDVDPRHGGDEVLEQHEHEHGPLPDTMECQTGGGGRHLYYTRPRELEHVKSKANALGPGVDVKCDGGYVVAPPSSHASGKPYEWEASSNPLEGRVTVAPPPAWIIEALNAGAPGDGPDPDRERLDTKAVLEGVPEGERDTTIYRLACKLRGADVPLEMALQLIAEAAGNCSPPFDVKVAEEKVRRAYGTYAPREDERPPLTDPDEAGVTVPDGLAPPAAPISELRTDMGNARRLARRFGNDVKHTSSHGWYVWDGKRWCPDEKGMAVELVKCSARMIFDEAKDTSDSEQAKQLSKWAVGSQSTSRVRGVLALGATEPEISARFSDFDRHPWLLTVANGTLDLRTGKLQPHRREDLLTRLSPVPYDPTAKCPLWRRFLHQIMDGDEEMVGLLQRAAGYSLTGDVSEQVWFFCYGTGANGKSTFLKALLDIIGDHGLKAVEALLIRTKNDSHPTEVADLAGVRLAICTEVDQGRSLNIVRIKEMTGGDRMTGRKMRQDFFQFEATHKIWLAANHQPTVSDTTESTWRRLVLIPFTVAIPKPEQDASLPKKLKDEFPGILAWAVEGCLQWQREGLQTPEKVRDAIQDYRTKEDFLGGFLDDKCLVGEVDEYGVTAADLYRAYGEWCEEQGLRTCSQKAFGTRLTERGFTRQKNPQTRRWEWFGVGLITKYDPSAGDKADPTSERRDLWD